MKLVSCLAFWLSLLSYNFAAQAAFIPIDEPPPGFEEDNISQHERVRLLVMNQPIGFHFVTIYRNKLQFTEIEPIVAQLVSLRDSSAVSELLKGEFPLNSFCLTQEGEQTEQCLALKKQPAFILYDPVKEEVSLFIAECHFMKQNDSQDIQFIPDSTANWSSLNYASELNQNYYNLFSNNVWAKENNSFIANLSNNNGFDDATRFQIQNAYFQRIQRDKIYSGGYLLSPMSPFFQTQTIAGVSVQTTLNTVKNPASILATPVILFIPQASQISIFRNEQLIFSEYLTAGYQTINMSSFPDGGYDLTIKIGPSNTLHQFFTKGAVLPPAKAPQYYLTGGYLTNGIGPDSNDYNYLPETLGIPILQAGYTYRINDYLALFESEEKQCTIPLPAITGDKAYLYLGDVACISEAR